tara:strand:+ start:5984 stop:7879 length:1896 start_codon:yes stop_codon:yes gene_type:complete
MKVLCSGAPRSGTSMLNLLMSYFKDLRVFMNGTPETLWENYDLFTTQQRPDGLVWNDFMPKKRHLTEFADEGIKVIYIYRDGRDALISKRKNFGITGVFGDKNYWYGPELFHVEKWFRSIEVMSDVINFGYNNIHVVKYEDLVENHVKEIEKIENFLELKIDKGYVNFYNDHKNEKNMSTEGAIGAEYAGLRPIEPNSGNWKKEKHKERLLDILSNYDDLEELLIDVGYESNKSWMNEIIEPITFVIPSRNNLDLLKLAYKSIKDLKGDHNILVLDDASEDGTSEWLEYTSDNHDDNLFVYTNPGPERIGIVGMFDKGIELAKTKIIMAFHADMVAGKNLDVAILKHLKPGKVVCATRVEPSLHPPGPEKVIEDFGLMPEEFDYKKWSKYNVKTSNTVTNGVFAPWCMYKDDFLSIGGHDELFAPQSREDSDLFNRFSLKGYELLQTWEGFVYHFTSRGSRFNKYSGGDVGKDSPEWQDTNAKNIRNFIRKWKTGVQHDPYMLPIVDPIYNVGFIVENCDINTLSILEPWCHDIYGDWVGHKGFGINKYIEQEQPRTIHNLKLKIHSDWIEPQNDVIVKFDVQKLTQEDFACIQKLGAILEDSGQIGEMKLGNLHFTIKKLEQIQHKNIQS